MTEAQHSEHIREIRNAFKISVRKHVGRDPLGDIKSKRYDYTKIDLKQIRPESTD
jgi:hypothetical protein